MSKPYIHALSSAKEFGGKPEDYMDIHELLDSSKATFAGDIRHRALTHNSWFIATILDKIFGSVRTNSAGKKYSVRDIGERHVSEDYNRKFIPSAQDFLVELEFKPWMNNGINGEVPPSQRKVAKKSATVRKRVRKKASDSKRDVVHIHHYDEPMKFD